MVPLEMDPAVELGLGLGPQLDMVKGKEGEPEVGGEPKTIRRGVGVQT